MAMYSHLHAQDVSPPNENKFLDTPWIKDWVDPPEAVPKLGACPY